MPNTQFDTYPSTYPSRGVVRLDQLTDTLEERKVSMRQGSLTATDKHDKAKVLDLFAGAGGTGLGFARAGFRIVGAVEIDPYAAETYEKNLSVQVKRRDLSELPPHVLR